MKNKIKILIADEITASLDTEMSKKVYKVLKEYIVKNNCIGIFVSHDPLIREFADDIYVMKNGSLIKENEIETIKNKSSELIDLINERNKKCKLYK